jgi:small subunit ribosomal protein S5
MPRVRIALPASLLILTSIVKTHFSCIIRPVVKLKKYKKFMVQAAIKPKQFNRSNNKPSTNWVRKTVKVRRITKVVKGGKKIRFGALVISGNEQGRVGVGIGKADDIREAVKKAVSDSKRNLITVPLTKNASIPHITHGQFGAAKVIIKPAVSGSGIKAGGSVRTLFEALGLKNVSAKQLGSGNLLNNARATIDALQSLKTQK